MTVQGRPTFTVAQLIKHLQETYPTKKAQKATVFLEGCDCTGRWDGGSNTCSDEENVAGGVSLGRY